ncbi:MAG: DUF1761 domain-containing protein [Pseudomonadota bacterium]
MGELTMGVNWLAVIVGAVLAFLLGWLWFSPKLFGEKWAAGVGVTLNEGPPPGAAMGFQAVGNILLSVTIGITAAANHLMMAILVVLTIVFLLVANGLFVQKSRHAVSVEAGFVIAMAVVMIVVQAIL